MLRATGFVVALLPVLFGCNEPTPRSAETTSVAATPSPRPSSTPARAAPAGAAAEIGKRSGDPCADAYGCSVKYGS